jgi:hypothetical protein
MLEYRERKKKETTTSGDAAPAPAAPKPKDAPAFMSLAERYGLYDMGFANAEDTEEQTVEQEYQAYVTAPLSQKGTNILKFWEASYSNGS